MSCGREHHHLCAAEHPWLKWIGTDKIEGRKCFDCWLLEAQLRKTVHALQVAVYYKQLTDWSRVTSSPFAIGAFLATAAILPQAVVKTTCTPATRERQVQGVQGQRRRAARVQLLHCRLPQLGSVPGRGAGGQRGPCQVGLVPVGMPGMLQEGRRRYPAGGAQADGSARGRRQEATQKEEVSDPMAQAICCGSTAQCS